LEQVSAELSEHQQAIDITTDIAEALAQADLVVTVTSALEAIVQPEMLKPGAVVCDVARPRDVSRAVADQRKDVLVIEGGVVKVPGEVQFNFDFGFPPQMAYACMAETMILALEGRCENFSLGRKLEPDKVREIGSLAKKHGFQLAGFRSFEQVVSQEQIQRVRDLTQRSTQQTAN
ncbi:MAG: shikimate dehydrogenase, partial [Armatimonadetes bacterium]|nr:shikimate dehydrogenase [Armatimonadota bacterium]